MSCLKDPCFPAWVVVHGRKICSSLWEAAVHHWLGVAGWGAFLPPPLHPSTNPVSGSMADWWMQCKMPLFHQHAVHLLGAKLSSLWAPGRGSGIDCTAAWAYLKVKVNSCCRKRARNCICCNICSCLFFLSAAGRPALSSGRGSHWGTLPSLGEDIYQLSYRMLHIECTIALSMQLTDTY